MSDSKSDDRRPNVEEIEKQVALICESRYFNGAEKRQLLFRDMINASLSGAPLTDRAIAIRLYGEDKVDSVLIGRVRVAKHGLREKLRDFYRSPEGKKSPVQITIDQHALMAGFRDGVLHRIERGPIHEEGNRENTEEKPSDSGIPFRKPLRPPPPSSVPQVEYVSRLHIGPECVIVLPTEVLRHLGRKCTFGVVLVEIMKIESGRCAVFVIKIKAGEKAARKISDRIFSRFFPQGESSGEADSSNEDVAIQKDDLDRRGSKYDMNGPIRISEPDLKACNLTSGSLAYLWKAQDCFLLGTIESFHCYCAVNGFRIDFARF